MVIFCHVSSHYAHFLPNSFNVRKQEVVIKSLGEMFYNQTAFAGAAILGDGRVGLILDIHALVKLKLKHGDAAA